MWLDAAMFAGGLAGLYFGAEWLVRGSARLARSLGISALVVGLTVVAFGTSSPELVVSLVAAIRDQPGVAVGNVVGSNVANIGLILGIVALVSPIRAQMRLVVREIPIMIVSGLVLTLFLLDGFFSRGEGAIMFAALVVYVLLMLWIARREPAATEEEYEKYETEERLVPGSESRGWDIVLVVAGLITLGAGAHLLVTGAVSFARLFGVSELMIGLTVVAIGTSLPELATSLIAAFRGEADIALGNIVGSNIFNVFAILGITALVHPIAADVSLLRFEIPVMLAYSLLLPVFAFRGLKIDRWEGGLLLCGYLVFTWVVIQRSLSGGFVGGG